MGEDFKWVNIDKKEYIDPGDFEYSTRGHGSVQKDGTVLAAVQELLANEWSGCQIAWMGDYAKIPAEGHNEFFSKLKKQATELPYDSSVPIAIIMDLYTNISGLFKAAEKEVREEIEGYLVDLARGIKDTPNYYRISADNPYKGFFTKNGQKYKYIINYSKMVCYSLGQTDICYQDGEICDFADPLPILMRYDGDSYEGEWFGDIISVSNELPDGIKLLEKVELDW